jgi:DEAD/DEAH box helicase domain-containing protein
MRKIVLDLETRNWIQDVGSKDPAALDISLVGLYDYETRMYYSFIQEEFERLWDFLENTDQIITYNGDHFDIPILNKYFKRDGRGDLTTLRSLDLMKEIKMASGRWPKLDQIAEGTLKVNKSGKGGEAVEWWKQGEVEKIRKYCLDDVRITKEIYEYALQNKKVLFKEGPFIREIKLDIKHWEWVPEIKTQSLF